MTATPPSGRGLSLGDTLALRELNFGDLWNTNGDALALGPGGEPMRIKGHHVHSSFAKVWHLTGDIRPSGWSKVEDSYAYPHPGYAWAIRRDTLDAIGGLIEISGLGAGDHQMAMSFVEGGGRAWPDPARTTRPWCVRGERAWRDVQGNFGYVAGTLEDLFHGTRRSASNTAGGRRLSGTGTARSPTSDTPFRGY